MRINDAAIHSFDASLWRTLQDQKHQRLEAQRRETLEKSLKALQAYFAHYPTAKAYVTGSILCEGRFAPWSDIDVAVAGFRGDYFRTLVDLEELLDRNVDLIELENCRFRESIEKQGLRVQ